MLCECQWVSSQNQTAGRLDSLVTSLSLPWWWVVPTAGYTQGSVKNSFDWRLRIGNIPALKWNSFAMHIYWFFRERGWLARSGGILCRRGKEVRCRWSLIGIPSMPNSHKGIDRCRRFSYLDSEGGVAVTGAPKILAFFGGFDLQKSMCTKNSKN